MVLKQTEGNDWQRAVLVDKAIRDQRPPYPLFVHHSRRPLTEAVIIPEDVGAEQLSLNLIDISHAPCDSGVCFV